MLQNISQIFDLIWTSNVRPTSGRNREIQTSTPPANQEQQKKMKERPPHRVNCFSLEKTTNNNCACVPWLSRDDYMKKYINVTWGNNMSK